MQPCSLLDCPCDCQRRCLVPKSWLRSLALRRKGVNIKRQSHQAQVKRTIPCEAVCRWLKLYFDAVSVAERKLKWLGFSPRHVVTLMFWNPWKICTWWSTRCSDPSLRSMLLAHFERQHDKYPMQTCAVFWVTFFSAFSKEFFPRPGSSEFVLPDAAVSVLRRWTCSIAFCYQLLPNCQTLKACRCRPVVLEAALFSASEVGVAFLSTHPWRQYCCAVWTQTFWALCVVLSGQSPCDESLVSSHFTSTTKLWFTKTRVLVSLLLPLLVLVLLPLLLLLVLLMVVVVAGATDRLWWMLYGFMSSCILNLLLLPSSGLYSETHGLFESSFGSKLRGLTTHLLCWSRLFHWHAHEQKSHDRHSRQSHLFCDFPLCPEQDCTGLWGCRRHWNAFWARLCPVPEQTLGQPNTSISRSNCCSHYCLGILRIWTGKPAPRLEIAEALLQAR